MCRRAAVTVGLALAICALAPAPASAGLLESLCTLGSETVPGAICKAATRVGQVIGIGKKVVAVGKKLAGGHLGSVLHTITGGASQTAARPGFAALVAWVLGGAAFALHETAKLLGKTTDPQLGSDWFSSTYIHMAAIATLLTLPFLCAAAVQAMMRSDLAMLARAALGYLPLAVIAIVVAANLTTVLLNATDSLSGVIEQAAGGEATHFLIKAGAILAGLSAFAHSPFVVFLIGFFVAAGALVLWLELLLREVAVYVIVLMLPLVFAAFVWPARRIWAIRAVELLAALILAKLAIVSVLALGGGALNHATDHASIASLLAGIALVTLGAFAPWALVKLMPLGELAAAAAGPLRGHFEASARSGASIAGPWADASSERAAGVIADMHSQAMAADPTPAQGADAEAARLSELGEADSREPAGPPDGVEGVAVGSSPDPLQGTADPPGGPAAGAPGEPGPAGSSGMTPHPPAPPEPPERGPSPPFRGFEDGEESAWRHDRDMPTLSLGPDQGAPPPDEPPPDDDDPRPPAQEPEGGRL
jgi:hypothetical protein